MKYILLIFMKFFLITKYTWTYSWTQKHSPSLGVAPWNDVDDSIVISIADARQLTIESCTAGSATNIQQHPIGWLKSHFPISCSRTPRMFQPTSTQKSGVRAFPIVCCFGNSFGVT
ncbi:MAG: hypothetical protein LBI92_06485 [Azoarcus sp.]|nr:hypothetical protein [Azoarcus sp.]